MKTFLKVLPGTFIKINLDNFLFEKTTYWSPNDYIDSKKFSEDKFFDLFSKSIDHRLVSDVPIANFLSGFRFYIYSKKSI